MSANCCVVSVASLYVEPSSTSEMISQILYGEAVEVIKEKKYWSYVKTCYDGTEGWVESLQLGDNKETQKSVLKSNCAVVNTFQGKMLLSLGSEISSEVPMEEMDVKSSVEEFLHVPYLKGGRSYFGIDGPGLVQLVYKKHGIQLPRFANAQAEMGELLSFVEESEPGDIAFFDDEFGTIVHSGIMLEDQKIVHSFGKVRVDILDSSGIFNQELNKHTHKLRFIKRITQ